MYIGYLCNLFYFAGFIVGREGDICFLFLLLAKSFCFLNGEKKLLFQLLKAFVWGQIQPVEAISRKVNEHHIVRSYSTS